jgi:hypothetical protein
VLIRTAPLEDDDMVDLLERELEEGVQIERGPDATITEDAKQNLLGGLVIAEEHVTVRDLKKK